MLDVDVITIIYDNQNTIIDSSGDISTSAKLLFYHEKVGNVNNALMHLGFTFLTTRYHEGLGVSATQKSIYIREKKNTP